MKIYAAIVSWAQEGTDIIGLFDSLEKAQAACDNHRYEDGTIRGDDRYVDEYELNKNDWLDN